MNTGIQSEIQLLILSFLTGCGLMAVYDVFRAFRTICPHAPVWVGIEDMIYWVYAGFVTFSLLYQQNDGSLRGYAIAGVLIGMILFNQLVSRFSLKLLKNVSKYFRMRKEKLRDRKQKRRKKNK